ncbi:ester cyclase [Streptomyces xanthochromogenes]|uniref:ester cyclase n=1 Tax=Streptomyces xanthochromogenes TaxID=67384 RepID=UPI00341CC26E
MTTPTTEVSAHRQLLEHYYEECLNKGDLDAVYQKAIPGHISHGTVAEGFEGVEHLREWVRIQRASFPDLHVVVDEWIEQADTVVQRFTARGTHSGEDYYGIPATGRPFEISGIVIDHFADGKIIESWFSMDSMELVKQLGLFG